MPLVQTVIPDGKKIKRLIYGSGYTQASFARAMRFGSARTIYSVCRESRPASIPQIFEIARVLKVAPEEISDYAAPPRKRRAA